MGIEIVQQQYFYDLSNGLTFSGHPENLVKVGQPIDLLNPKGTGGGEMFSTPSEIFG